MKKIVSILFIAALVGCESEQDKTGSMGPANRIDSATVANYRHYKPSYEPEVSLGDAKHVNAIMDVWKGWEVNDFEGMKDHFADTVTMMFGSGDILAGPRDSVLMGAKQWREGFQSMNVDVQVVIPIKGETLNENWVTIWGKETYMDKQGKTDSSFVSESWRFNNNNKIDLMLQYVRSAPKQ